ncbi:hypothetical protein BKA70DRAFT_366906 [Coprinopsis sp. MPI-PUGE-AT-0042]|nr:hypothetical protein BKA70DRAFT_366906 [Coprinopsis sp. MPI-PUGE-AT-0042]
MISAVAARRAAAAASTSSAPALTSAPATAATTPQADEDVATSKPNSKRSKPPTPATTRNAKKAKVKDAGVERQSKRRRDGRKPVSSKKQGQLQQQQPRYFSTASSSNDSKTKQEDHVKEGKEVIDLGSSSEEESSELSSSCEGEEDEEGVTLLHVNSKRQQRTEGVDSSSSDEDGMDVDIDVEDLTSFSVLGTPHRHSTTSTSVAQPASTENAVLSTFDPTFDENVFQLSPNECIAVGAAQGASVVLLQPHEALCLLGTCSLRILYGEIEMFGTTLSADEAYTSHRIFAPSSAPLPIIRCSFSSPAKPSSSKTPFTSRGSSLLSSFPERVQKILQDDATLLKSGSVLLFTPLSTGVERLGIAYRLFEDVFVPSKWQRQLNNAADRKSDGLGVDGLFVVHQQSRDVVPFVLPTLWSEALDEVLSLSSLTTSASFHPTSHYSSSNLDDSSATSAAFLVKGPRNSGKSTFARTLLNRLLASYERVAFLECDLGQSEFTPPGMVSLNVLYGEDGRVFGPPFTHLTIPYAAHYVGATTPRSLPDYYLEAVRALVERYQRDFADSGYDDQEDEGYEDDGDDKIMQDDTAKPRNTKKKSKRVPLIVNTMGWTKGLGADLNARIEELVREMGGVVFSLGGEEGNGDGAAGSDGPSRGNESAGRGGVGGGYAAFGTPSQGIAGMDMGSGGGMMATLDPSMGHHHQSGTLAQGSRKPTYDLSPPDPIHVGALSKRWTSADWRTLSLMSWFYGVFSEPPSSSTRSSGQRMIARWNIASPLLCHPPLEVSIHEALDRLVLGGAGYEDVIPGEVGRVVNGAIVGVVVRDRLEEGDEEEGWHDENVREGARKTNVWGYQQASAPPALYDSRCIGLALVRGVHPSLTEGAGENPGATVEAKVQLLSPLPVDELVKGRVWVKGELEMPVWGMVDWRGWIRRAGVDKRNEVELVVDPDGSSGTVVPYLQWGRGDLGGRAIGGEKKRVRRNLMRKGQQ